jgi:hypothetical protein
MYGVGSNPQSIKGGDFNGDANLDLVVANSFSNNLAVLLGNGDGTFHVATFYATGSVPAGVSVGDFNHDGNVDLVAANFNTNDVSVFLGNGDGSFRPQMSYVTDSPPAAVSVADFNGDGNLDIVTASTANGTLSILFGGGDGTFQPAVKYATDSVPYSLASVVVGDLNGDGEIDVASAFGGNMRILLGEQVATFSLNGIAVPGTGAQDVVALYSGDGSRIGSQSNVVTLMGLTDSALLLSSSSDPSTYGGLVTFTATPTPGATGTIRFTDGATVIGTATINGGVASVSIGSLSAGNHAIAAVYEGDRNFAGSTSPTVVQIVNKATASINLTSSGNPSSYGDPVILTATVTPGATGAVTFTDGTITLGIVTLDASGKAAISNASLQAGSHNISATYSGDSNHY